MSDATCEHVDCTDDGDMTLHTEDGGTYRLCEDHYHMNHDGTPVDGYTPNNPAKFDSSP